MNVKETRRTIINSKKIDFIFIICYVIYSILFYAYVSMMAMPEYDAADYLINARDWVSNEPLYRDFRPPLISWIIAGVYSLTGENWIIIKYLMPVFTLAAGLVLYKHFKEYKGSMFAFGVTALTLLNPYVFFWSTQILTEGLSLFFLVMTLYFCKSNNKNSALLAGIMLGLTFASRYPIAIQAFTIVIVEAIIRKNPKYLVRVLTGAAPIILIVVLAVYMKSGSFSGAISQDTIFIFPPSSFYLLNWQQIWGFGFLLAPLALLFRRTWMDKYNYTFIAWFIIALLFWSSNSYNYQPRFAIQFTPAISFLVILALENISKFNFSLITNKIKGR
jgi:4-amino-4-deoxy-L-arabinose transferase-like glycosyltransferase